MDLDEKKLGTLGWLVSVSEYRREVLGLGAGMGSAGCHSSLHCVLVPLTPQLSI